MKTFVEFFKDRTNNALTMCNVTVHDLDLIVKEYTSEYVQGIESIKDKMKTITDSLEKLGDERPYKRPLRFKVPETHPVPPLDTYYGDHRHTISPEDMDLYKQAGDAGLFAKYVAEHRSSEARCADFYSLKTEIKNIMGDMPYSSHYTEMHKKLTELLEKYK